MRWPAGFRHFEPIQHWEVNDTATPQSGRTTFAIPFTASTPGEYSLSPMELAWFDPATEKYHTKSTDSLIVHVLAAPKSPPAAPVAATPKPKPEPQTTIIIFLILLAVIILIGIIFVVRRRRRLSTKMPATNAPKVNAPISTTPEPPVSTSVSTPTPPAIINSPEDIKQTLLQFLQQHLQTDAWAEEDLIPLLQQKDPSLTGKVTNLINECNELLYSPHRSDRRTMTRLIRQLDAIIKKP